MKSIIKKGDRFKVRDNWLGHVYYGQVLTVTNTVEPESKDGFICFTLEKRVKVGAMLKQEYGGLMNFARTLDA